MFTATSILNRIIKPTLFYTYRNILRPHQGFIGTRYILDAYYKIEKICMNLWWFEAKCLSLQHESITARGCSGDQSGDAFSQLDRLKYALRRYRKKHTEAEYEAHKEKVLNNLLNGINFYTAFDLQQFKFGSQYRHIENLVKKLRA